MAHPNPHIRQAIEYGERKGWRFIKAGGRAHLYGTLLCPKRDRDGHRIMVLGSPKSQQHHARRITKALDACEHSPEPQDRG
ncbi:MAG: hypothetical protein AAGD32_15255 [Planctomycetota bacterium]